MRSFLTRYAPAIYIGGALSCVIGFIVILYASALVGSIIAGVGYVGMAATHRSVGA